MPSFATVYEYTCGHTQEAVHFSTGEDDKVIRDTLPVATRCRMCLCRAVLSAVSSNITCLPLSAIREAKDEIFGEIYGMSQDDTRLYLKALAQRVCRPSEMEGFQAALGELVA
ncbi:hypothetical protein PG994_013928 [Apiospora phragmitis]|uniref:Uncharacterized protein n=1 Tax=Apiospora phragmitis TaxID=2905665 RepID=A0ABR1T2U9_9PEZI